MIIPSKVYIALMSLGLFFVHTASAQLSYIDQSVPPPGELADENNTATATFVESSMAIDGRLDEEVWGQAAVVSDFKQHEPGDGVPATQKTEVRVLYGSTSLYIGAVLYDDDPNAIEKTLGRRDDYNRADWFWVSIDGYLERRTAYSFGVNAAGVQLDAILSSSGRGGGNAPRGMDTSWDAVWYSNVRVTPEGWIAEMRIPYSMLRFPDAQQQVWGVHFTRRNPRLGEQSEWPHIPLAARENLVAEFGTLEGIRDIKPRRNIQITPYTVSQVQSEEDPDNLGQAQFDQNFDVGGDLKVGLGPNVTLDATINPDFGQVDADPAVLNLTAFENFFSERRPFFVEGTQIYQFRAGPGRLLYTRRIGSNAPIIGATKLSGRTASGLSFGVLGAATGDNFNPDRQFGVGRLIQQVGSYSSIGGIVTVLNGEDSGLSARLRTVAAGADWDLRFADNKYGIEGFFSVTNRNFLETGFEDQSGFAGKVWLRKRQGAWNGIVGFDVFSDDFNPNDVGQLFENNFIAALSSIEHQVNGGKPFGPFLRAELDMFIFKQFAYDDGLNLGESAEFSSEWTFRGFQNIWFGGEVENFTGGYDIFETRGLLPWAPPAQYELGFEYETDSRRNWQVEPGMYGGLFDNGGSFLFWWLEGRLNLGSRFSLEGELDFEAEYNRTAWASNQTFRRSATGWEVGEFSASPSGLSSNDYVAFDDQGSLDALVVDAAPVEEGTYYLSTFGRRDTRSVDFTIRSSYTLSPRLSLQLYTQFFAARGRYDDFQLQVNRDMLADFDAYPKRNEFSLNSIQSNLVLRWEYRPGSSLFLVWTHGRQGEDRLNPLAPWGRSPFDRSFNGQFGDTFDVFPENVFLIKLNYTFLY